MEQWKELTNIKTKVQQFIAYRSPIPKVHVGRINFKLTIDAGKMHTCLLHTCRRVNRRVTNQQNVKHTLWLC